jgi:hypothetical protein
MPTSSKAEPLQLGELEPVESEGCTFGASAWVGSIRYAGVHRCVRPADHLGPHRIVVDFEMEVRDAHTKHPWWVTTPVSQCCENTRHRQHNGVCGHMNELTTT